MDAYLIVFSKLVLELYSLFQPFEAPGMNVSESKPGESSAWYTPVSFLFFKGGHAQKFLNSLLRIIYLHLLGIVVFVLDANIPCLLFIIVFIFEVISQYYQPR